MEIPGSQKMVVIYISKMKPSPGQNIPSGVPDKSGSRVISAVMYFCPNSRELHDPELNAKIHG